MNHELLLRRRSFSVLLAALAAAGMVSAGSAGSAERRMPTFNAQILGSQLEPPPAVDTVSAPPVEAASAEGAMPAAMTASPSERFRPAANPAASAPAPITPPGMVPAPPPPQIVAAQPETAVPVQPVAAQDAMIASSSVPSSGFWSKTDAPPIPPPTGAAPTEALGTETTAMAVPPPPAGPDYPHLSSVPASPPGGPSDYAQRRDALLAERDQAHALQGQTMEFAAPVPAPVPAPDESSSPPGMIPPPPPAEAVAETPAMPAIETAEEAIPVPVTPMPSSEAIAAIAAPPAPVPVPPDAAPLAAPPPASGYSDWQPVEPPIAMPLAPPPAAAAAWNAATADTVEEVDRLPEPMAIPASQLSRAPEPEPYYREDYQSMAGGQNAEPIRLRPPVSPTAYTRTLPESRYAARRAAARRYNSE